MAPKYNLQSQSTGKADLLHSFGSGMTYDRCYVALIHHHHVLFGKKILSAVVGFVCFHTESPEKVRIGIDIANKFKQHHLVF